MTKRMHFLFLAPLLTPLASAWVVPPPLGRQRTTTTMSRPMNIFGDFFKVPTYKKKEEPTPAEPKQEQEPVATVEEAKVPDVQEFDAQQEELSALTKEEEVEEEAKEEPVAVVKEPVEEIKDEQEPVVVPKEEEAVVAQKLDVSGHDQATVEPVAREGAPVAAARHHGSVDWFHVSKGYGFITPNEHGAENIFVHQKAIKMEGFRKLVRGQHVSYEVETADDGRTRAVQVTVEAAE